MQLRRATLRYGAAWNHCRALGYDAIAIVDNGCVDESKLIRLNPEDTAAGLQHAEDASY